MPETVRVKVALVRYRRWRHVKPHMPERSCTKVLHHPRRIRWRLTGKGSP